MRNCAPLTGSFGKLLVCAVSAAIAFTSMVAPAAAQSGSGEMKPMAVIAVTSYDELLTDIDFMGQFGGQVKAGQQLNNMLLLFTQNKGLEGLDKSKPWGAVVQTDGFQFIPVVCLPVTDLDALLNLANMFQMTTSDAGDGITEIELPNQSIYVKKQGNWAYLSQGPDQLANVPANPGPMFEALAKEYDVAARVMVQNVPEMYRSIAVEQLRAGAQQGMQQLPNETDEAFEARSKMAEANVEQIVKFINSVDELEIGFNADEDQSNVTLDFNYSAVPGSELAQQIEAFTTDGTMFAGCMREGAAMQFNMTSQTPQAVLEANREVMEGQMNAMRQQVMNAIDQEDDIPNEAARATVKEAANDLIDALEATAFSGKFDSAGHIYMSPSAMQIVFGGYLKEPNKVESGLKKLAALVEGDPGFAGVDWNADSHANVNIHTTSVPVPDDEDEIQRILGDTMELAVGIGEDTMFLSLGSDSVETLKKAIDGSQSARPVRPFEVELNLSQIIETAALLDQTGNADIQAVADALSASEGEDSIRLTADRINSDKVRFRIELEEGVLKTIGVFARQAQRQGAAAGF